jgi:5-methylthioribose kinase
MVRRDGSTRAFDSEFSFYGPIGLDLGFLWGDSSSRPATRCSLAKTTPTGSPARWARSCLGFESELRARWPERIHARVFTDDFLEHRLREIVRDAAGFAAADAARWVIGRAHASDVETLEPDARIAAVRGVLASARRLLLGAAR